MLNPTDAVVAVSVADQRPSRCAVSARTRKWYSVEAARPCTTAEVAEPPGLGPLVHGPVAVGPYWTRWPVIAVSAVVAFQVSLTSVEVVEAVAPRPDGAAGRPETVSPTAGDSRPLPSITRTRNS